MYFISKNLPLRGGFFGSKCEVCVDCSVDKSQKTDPPGKEQCRGGAQPKPPNPCLDKKAPEIEDKR